MEIGFAANHAVYILVNFEVFVQVHLNVKTPDTGTCKYGSNIYNWYWYSILLSHSLILLNFTKQTVNQHLIKLPFSFSYNKLKFLLSFVNNFIFVLFVIGL